MNEYEKLMYKSELARQAALKSETNWAWQYWNKVADKLQEKALLLNVGDL
jgi:DNA-directed RNA polymerase subunit F